MTMPNITFNSEKDVRRWCRNMFGADNCIWVEAGGGSTKGVPDLLVMAERRLCPIELKCGLVDSKGRWQIDLRPAQKQVIRRMVIRGINATILVGSKGKCMMWRTTGAIAIEQIDKGNKGLVLAPIMTDGAVLPGLG